MKAHNIFSNYLFILCSIFVSLAAVTLLIPCYTYAESHQTTEDNMITAKIKSKIALEPSLSNFKINVETYRGKAILSGTVDSDNQADTAIELAQSVSGVTDVDAGKLVIKKSSQPYTDVAITAKIKGKFIQEKLFGDKDISAVGISVETNDGIVTLAGYADNQQQIENALLLASSVESVRDIKLNIQLRK